MASNDFSLLIERVVDFDPSLLQENDRIEIIVKFSGDIFMVAEAVGAEVEVLNSNFAIITIPLQSISELYDYKEIEYLELPRNLTFFLDKGLSQACITTVQSQYGFNLKGNGVVVGIIDSGIDYTHPDFKNPDGTTRILYIWDQTIPGNNPTGFLRGSEYTESEINEALQSEDPYLIVPSRDYDGHGTAVASVAAGSGSADIGLTNGVAPESFIIVVKIGNEVVQSGSVNSGTARTTAVMRAIKYIIDKAEILSMPVSINLSYGTNDGAHSGQSLFESFIDDMAQRWRTVISVASGNEGSAAHHYFGKVNQGETLAVDFVISGNPEKVYMTLWKNFADDFSFELISPAGRSTGIIRQSQSYTQIVLDGVYITIVNSQPTQYTVEQEIYFFFSGSSQPISPGVWTLNVRGENIIDGNFDIWLPTLEDVSTDTAFLRPNVETTLTIPSTAYYVITVGGYNSNIDASANFSGRGYTRQNVSVKPDLVAPAVGITTARAGGGTDSFSGTSIATPFVTGSAALMMEWGIIKNNDQFLYGQRVKAFLQKGATRDFLITYPNPLWGYGKLCLNKTMNLLVEYVKGEFSI